MERSSNFKEVEYYVTEKTIATIKSSVASEYPCIIETGIISVFNATSVPPKNSVKLKFEGIVGIAKDSKLILVDFIDPFLMVALIERGIEPTVEYL